MTLAPLTLTATPTTLNPGTARVVWVHNTGSTIVTLRNGQDVVQVNPGRDLTVQVAGPVMAWVTAPDGGAGTVSYDAEGTATLSESIPWVDVKAAGAAVDGATDDWPLVSGLIAAGGQIVLPPGVHYWRLTGTTTLAPAGTTLIGTPGRTVILLDSDVPGAGQREFLRNAGDNFTITGCVIKRASAFGLVVFPVQSHDGVTVADCVIDGQTATLGNALGAHFMQWGMTAGTATRIRVRDTKIMGVGFGVLQPNTATGATSDVRFDECTFTGNYGDDLGFNGPSGLISNVVVEDCAFANNAATTTAAGFAVATAYASGVKVRGCTISGYFNEGLHVEDWSSDIEVTDNTFIDCGTGTSQWISVLSGATNVTIARNTIKAVATTGAAAAVSILQAGTGTTPSGHSYIPPSDIRILDNDISMNAAGYGVYATGVTDLRIAGNRIRGTGSLSGGYYSGPSTYAFGVDGGTNVTITDNEIIGWKWGVYPQNGTTTTLGSPFVVSGNTFTACHYGLPGVNFGNGTVSGNTFSGCESSLGFSYDGAAVGSIVCAGNHAVGCTNPMAIYGSQELYSSAAQATGSGVTVHTYGAPLAMPSGAVVRFDGGGVLTLSGSTACDATTLPGTLTGANVVNGEHGVAYWPWSTASKAVTLADNSDDKLGLGGYGRKVVAAGASYTFRGWEDLVIGWAAGITIKLPPAANLPGQVRAVSNTSAGNLTVGSLGGNVLGAATYTLPGTANSVVRVVSDGTNWLAA